MEDRLRERNRTGTDTNKKDSKEKQNRIWILCFVLIWCAQMAAAVSFCCQKKGFHEDEYYSYYSTSRTYGLLVEDGAWMEHDDYYNEFVVLPGEGFQYGLVKLVQSWDVHPPVYYWILHTVCSCFPGQFSKWFGLGINLAAFGVSLWLLYRLALQMTGRNEKLSLLVLFFYGFTPAAMSSVTFIRMYALLTVFVYLCTILHMKELERVQGKPPGEKLSWRGFLLPIAVVTYLGFLTQYYYFIFLFFMAAAFCIWLLWRDRNLFNGIRYGGSLAAAFVLAYLTYPSCLGQMFRGQRGAQATSNFFELSNTMSRLAFYFRIANEYVFGKTLPLLLILLLCLFLSAVWRRRTGKKSTVSYQTGNSPEFPCEITSSRSKSRERACPLFYVIGNFVLLFSVLGYFVVVSKTALLLGETSVRYQMPIYGMAVLLLFQAFAFLTSGIKAKGIGAKGMAVAAVVCLIVNLSGLLSGKVVFLYPEDAEQVAYAGEKAAENIPAVYLYDAGQSWCVWDCADEFFAYDRIYFASQDSAEEIADPVISQSRELIVYLGHTPNQEEQIQRILDSSPNLTAYELQYRENYCDVYYFH